MAISARHAILVLTIALLLLHSAGSDAGAAQSSVTWLEVRNAILETICVPKTDGEDSSYPVLGDRAGCAHTADVSALGEVVDAAIADALPLIASIPGYQSLWITQFRAQPVSSDQVARDGQAKTAFLNDPSLLDPIMSRVIRALADRQITCQDCPAPRARVVRTVSVGDVAPYVLAFISLDPIESIASDGTPLENPKYAFHVCSGANTVTTLPHDGLLARAGFLGARGLRPVVGEQVMKIVSGADFKKLKTDVSRTAYARPQLRNALSSSADLKASICQAASRFGSEIGFSVSDCPR